MPSRAQMLPEFPPVPRRVSSGRHMTVRFIMQHSPRVPLGDGPMGPARDRTGTRYVCEREREQIHVIGGAVDGGKGRDVVWRR